MARYRPGSYFRYYGRTRLSGRAVAVALGALLAMGAAGQQVAAHAGTHHHHHGGSARSAVVAQVISYARAQLGKPYCWGGTGAYCPNPPYTGYDCSGLVFMAYRSAGVTIPRTTFDQWPNLPHVPASKRQAGDLVFAPGSDGSMASPGHVGLLIGRNTVIQAYANGVPIDIVSLATFIAGADGLTGYARVTRGP